MALGVDPARQRQAHQVVLGVLALFGQRLLPTFEFLVPGPPEGNAPVRATTPPEIRRLTLDNGLTVILHEEG